MHTHDATYRKIVSYKQLPDIYIEKAVLKIELQMTTRKYFRNRYLKFHFIFLHQKLHVIFNIFFTTRKN